MFVQVTNTSSASISLDYQGLRYQFFPNSTKGIPITDLIGLNGVLEQYSDLEVSGIMFDATYSGMSAETIKDAIDEIDERVDILENQWLLTSPFGQDYKSEQDNSESNWNTDTEFQEKLSLSWTPTDLGRYRIGWSCEFKDSSSSFDGSVRVTIDGIIINNFENEAELSDSYTAYSGFRDLALDASEHSILIEYKTNNIASEVSIRNARLEVWRSA